MRRYRHKTPLVVRSPTMDQVQEHTQVLLKAFTTEKKVRPIRVKTEIVVEDKLANKVLILKGRQLRQLDLQDHHSVTYVDASNNMIREIKIDNPLKVLIVSQNRITSLQDLPEELTILDASMNHISAVCLKNLKYLRVLNLQKNQLQSIDLVGLHRIQKISLDDNKISYIDIPSLPRLQTITLSNNNLQKALDCSILANIPQIQHIDINGNQFNKLVTCQNYLNIMRQEEGSRQRCKSVEQQHRVKVTELVIKEQRLNIVDLQTPLTQQKSAKPLMNQVMMQKLMQKQESCDNKRFSCNQFSVKSAKFSFTFDRQLLNKKSIKYQYFNQAEITQIDKIKSQYFNGDSSDEGVYKQIGKLLICYGNPEGIDCTDVTGIVIKYYPSDRISRSNVFIFNKIEQLTLKNNRIVYLHQLQHFPRFCSNLITFNIHKNPINQSSLLKSYISCLFNFDDQSKLQYQKYLNLKQPESAVEYTYKYEFQQSTVDHYINSLIRQCIIENNSIL